MSSSKTFDLKLNKDLEEAREVVANVKEAHENNEEDSFYDDDYEDYDDVWDEYYDEIDWQAKKAKFRRSEKKNNKIDL